MTDNSPIKHDKRNSATTRFRKWMEERHDSKYPESAQSTVRQFFRFVKRDLWDIPTEEFVFYEGETADGPWLSPEELCNKSKREINDLLQKYPHCADFQACITYEENHEQRKKVLRRLRQRKRSSNIDYIWVSEEDVRQIGYEEAEEFVKHKKRQGCIKSTIGSYLDRLRKFDKWATLKYWGDIRDERLDFTPAEDLYEHMDKTRTISKSLSVDQVKQLLERNRGTTARALILTGVKTGARRGELHNLDWQNINLEEKYLIFEERKMGHEHVKALFDAECARALHALYHEQGCPSDDDPVFVHSHGGRMAKSTILKQVQGYAENADVSFNVKNQRVNTHTLRHTFRNHYETTAGDTRRGLEFLCDIQLSHDPNDTRDAYRVDHTEHTFEERRKDYRRAVPKYLI